MHWPSFLAGVFAVLALSGLALLLFVAEAVRSARRSTRTETRPSL